MPLLPALLPRVSLPNTTWRFRLNGPSSRLKAMRRTIETFRSRASQSSPRLRRKRCHQDRSRHEYRFPCSGWSAPSPCLAPSHSARRTCSPTTCNQRHPQSALPRCLKRPCRSHRLPRPQQLRMPSVKTPFPVRRSSPGPPSPSLTPRLRKRPRRLLWVISASPPARPSLIRICRPASIGIPGCSASISASAS